jgi:hypothetical protein
LSFHLKGLSRVPDSAVRQELLDGLQLVLGAASTANLNGYPAFDVAKLSDSAVAARLEAWLAGALDRMR